MNRVPDRVAAPPRRGLPADLARRRTSRELPLPVLLPLPAGPRPQAASSQRVGGPPKSRVSTSRNAVGEIGEHAVHVECNAKGHAAAYVWTPERLDEVADSLRVSGPRDVAEQPARLVDVRPRLRHVAGLLGLPFDRRRDAERRSRARRSSPSGVIVWLLPRLITSYGDPRRSRSRARIPATISSTNV